MGTALILCFSIRIHHPLFAGFREALPSLRSATITGHYSRDIARTYQDSGHVLRHHPGIILYATGDPRGRINGVSWSINMGVSHNRTVCLKDQASIESFQIDQIYLSLGCMTIVTKKMEAAEDKERIAEKLKQLIADIGD